MQPPRPVLFILSALASAVLGCAGSPAYQAPIPQYPPHDIDPGTGNPLVQFSDRSALEGPINLARGVFSFAAANKVDAYTVENMGDDYPFAGRINVADARDEMEAGTSLPSPPPPPPRAPERRVERKLIYNGTMKLRVPNPETSRATVDSIIAKHGGHIQNATLDTIIFRVPPDRFGDALDALAELGEVLQREVSVDDVTEAYVDLELRIEVADRALRRLFDLLEKAEKIEDMIELEKNIRRLTEEIESMKGKLRVLAGRVDMATVTVHLIRKGEPSAPRISTRGPRFSWMYRIGIEQAMGRLPDSGWTGGDRTPARWVLGPKFELGGDRSSPEGFVTVVHRSDLLWAVTPDDSRLRVTVIEPGPDADLNFWREVVENELEGNRGYILDPSAEVPMESAKLSAWKIGGETSFDGRGWKYHVWLVSRRDPVERLIAVEYVHIAGAEETRLGEVEAAVRSMSAR